MDQELFFAINFNKSQEFVCVALQVVKREKMAKIREEIAVQKAKETELNKTIHLTGNSKLGSFQFMNLFALHLGNSNLMKIVMTQRKQ